MPLQPSRISGNLKSKRLDAFFATMRQLGEPPATAAPQVNRPDRRETPVKKPHLGLPDAFNPANRSAAVLGGRSLDTALGTGWDLTGMP